MKDADNAQPSKPFASARPSPAHYLEQGWIGVHDTLMTEPIGVDRPYLDSSMRIAGGR
jgi:hypothetical protein